MGNRYSFSPSNLKKITATLGLAGCVGKQEIFSVNDKRLNAAAGKKIFGYQVFGANISTGNFSLCYCLRRCCPENGSKIDMAVQLLDALPETDAHVILQMDSWYTCKALWGKALEKTSRSLAL